MACIKKRRGKWVVDWRDAQGRRHWETMADKKSASDRLAEVLKNQGVTLATDDRTVKEYGGWWLEKIAKLAIKASTADASFLFTIPFRRVTVVLPRTNNSCAPRGFATFIWSRPRHRMTVSNGS